MLRRDFVGVAAAIIFAPKFGSWYRQGSGLLALDPGHVILFNRHEEVMRFVYPSDNYSIDYVATKPQAITHVSWKDPEGREFTKIWSPSGAAAHLQADETFSVQFSRHPTVHFD